MDIPVRIHCTVQCTNQGARPHAGHLVGCELEHGRGSLFKGKILPKRVVSAGVSASYKSLRDKSCKRGSVSGTTRRLCQDPHRQQNRSVVHSETRRHKKFQSKFGGLSALEKSKIKEHNVADPTLVVNKGQCDGRLSVSPSFKSVGVPVICRRVQFGSGSFPCKSNAGHFCFQGNKPTAKIHELVSGPAGSSKGCNVTSLGSNILCIPTNSSNSENASKNREGKDQSDNDLAPMANSSLVASGSESNVVPSSTPSQLPKHPDNGGQISRSAQSKPISCSSSSSKNLNFTSDPDLDKFLSNHLASGTQKGYNSSYSKFTSFCLSKEIDPTNCQPEDIAKYLQFLYESGASYSTINLARSSISKFHVGFNGTPAGQHQIVCNAVKAVFRLRPPLPKYNVTYDVTIVLDYLKSLPPNPQLPLKLLTYKALFLLIVSSISRVNSVSKLGPTLSVFKVNT